MFVGVGRLVLDYYGNQSLKKKREEVAALCELLKKQFNVSAMEVADFDDAESCVIGFAAVLPENWSYQRAEDFVRKLCESVDGQAFARLVLDDWDVLEHGNYK